MKIGVSDPDGYMFSQQLIDHWKAEGHEVMQSLYHEEEHVKKCDVLFYDFASGAVEQLGKEPEKPKRVIVRAIDIENYFGYYRHFKWDYIDEYIFINQSIYDLVKEMGDFLMPESKVHIIPPGIDMNKYTLTNKERGRERKAVFLGRLWIGKNLAGALEVVEMLNKHTNYEWTLHIRADSYDPPWWTKYCQYRLENSDVPHVMEPRVESVNDYLDDKDLMIVSSFKETFSYTAAEALAKGIPTLINDWYGSKNVWPDELIYRTSEEAVEKYRLLEWKHPQYFRDIASKYDEKIMFEKIDALLQG